MVFIYLEQLDNVRVVQLPQRLYLVLKHFHLLRRHARLVNDLHCTLFPCVERLAMSNLPIST
jgi:hypothetical protein